MASIHGVIAPRRCPIRVAGTSRAVDLILLLFVVGTVGCAGRSGPETAPAARAISSWRLERPPAPPCTTPSQYERARSPAKPDSVTNPRAELLTLLPDPPLSERPMTAIVTFRVDSTGYVHRESIVIEGIRDDKYRTRAMEQLVRMEFRPAMLLPDGCSVPGISKVTFKR